MKESLRRVILFAMIVITGSILILFDVPLIVLVPLIIAVGFVTLLLLGAITVADIRSVFSKKPDKKTKKPGIIQRLNEMKFFEKTPSQPDKKTAVPQKKDSSVVSKKPGEKTKKPGIIQRLNEMKFFEKTPAQPDKKTASPVKKDDTRPNPAGKTGAGTHIRSFLSSLGSLTTVLKQRSKQEKKVEHINELLDKAVSEKVKGSALASAGNGADTKVPLPGTGISQGSKGPGNESDPFLSLSGDEFDVSLLDGLDDENSPLSPPSPEGMPSLESTGGTDLSINEHDIPLPSLDSRTEAENILNDNADNLEEFKGLEGGESIDKDFGDLENLSLDDVDLDIDEELPSGDGSTPSSPSTPDQAPPSGTSSAVKTAWIPSDAPSGASAAENEVSTQADMASFASGASGTDEDMLSSLASDVKHVKKEQNTSLLRDLKDFKAPATDIESELDSMYQRMKASRGPEKKAVPGAKKMK